MAIRAYNRLRTNDKQQATTRRRLKLSPTQKARSTPSDPTRCYDAIPNRPSRHSVARHTNPSKTVNNSGFQMLSVVSPQSMRHCRRQFPTVDDARF